MIRIEKLTLDLILIQHRIVRNAEPFGCYREIIEIFGMTLDGVADDLSPAVLEMACRRVQRANDRIRQARSDLADDVSEVL